MNTCEDFEIAIEKRAHLALDGSGAEKLDAHLATCEPCQRFEALVLHTERIMSNSATAAAASVNWDELSANLARTHKGMAEQVTWRADDQALRLLAGVAFGVGERFVLRVNGIIGHRSRPR